MYKLPYTGAEIESLLKGISNKNLLHNWDFRNPVNQRGQSSYSGVGYTIDRWKIFQADRSTDIVSNGIRLYTSATTVGSMIGQVVEFPAIYVGETITFSVNVASITSNSVSIILSNGSVLFANLGNISSTGIHYVTGTVPSGTTYIECRISRTDSANPADFVISQAKLEFGSVSTLANDPPADYGEQLALCQRYFYLLKSVNANNFGVFVSGGCISTTQFRGLVEFPVVMRIPPSITSGGSMRYSNWSGAFTVAISSFATQTFNGKNMLLLANATGMTAGDSGFIQANSDTGAYIAFSADL